jgi:putative glutamine amidotransferase
VADDGTIEAVSVRDAKAFAIGVQWHPEFWASQDKPSKAIFEAFGDACRHRLYQRTHRAAAE